MAVYVTMRGLKHYPSINEHNNGVLTPLMAMSLCYAKERLNEH